MANQNRPRYTPSELEAMAREAAAAAEQHSRKYLEFQVIENTLNPANPNRPLGPRQKLPGMDPQRELEQARKMENNAKFFREEARRLREQGY